MAFSSLTNPSDEYMNDIKLDPSIVLPESANCLRWVTFPNQPIFAGTFWDKTVRVF